MGGRAVAWVAGRQSAMALVAVALFVFFSLAAPAFLNAQSLVLIVQQTAFVGMVAVAFTFLMTAGELDLSMGSAYGLASILTAWLITSAGKPLSGEFHGQTNAQRPDQSAGCAA
jgi:ribose/xylose/arabinose/galactoside ABC-type transport system permease subunit